MLVAWGMEIRMGILGILFQGATVMTVHTIPSSIEIENT